MAVIVQKFGGSSVGTLDRIHHVAAKIIKAKEKGHQVIVVVSAMYGETDRLIRLAHALTPTPDPREYDVLLATGEQVSMALLAMALNAKNCPARSFTGQQIGILTDDQHSNAQILHINKQLIEQELAKGNTLIIAGFQGANAKGDVTTLGRGGSDTTAVALAIAMQAEECQIYTDVEGVFTTDPHLVPEARLLPFISFKEMLTMSRLGAKVLQMRSVELAHAHSMPIRVLSTFSDTEGTLVTFENHGSEKASIIGISFERDEALVTIPSSENIQLLHDELDAVFKEHNLNSKKIIITDNNLNLLIKRRDFAKTLSLLETIKLKSKPTIIAKTAQVSLIGELTKPAISNIEQSLKKLGITCYTSSQSELNLSFIIEEMHLDTAVKALHQLFELDKNPRLGKLASINM